MWDINEPAPVKLIIGILAADEHCMNSAIEEITETFGAIDMLSDTWPFTQTHYYDRETGPNILRKFVTLDQPIHPGRLAEIKHQTNHIEQRLAQALSEHAIRPVNLDPGIVEPSKLVLASTKNFSHRIYLRDGIYAEVSLMLNKRGCSALPWTYPDLQSKHASRFLLDARSRYMSTTRQDPRERGPDHFPPTP